MSGYLCTVVIPPSGACLFILWYKPQCLLMVHECFYERNVCILRCTVLLNELRLALDLVFTTIQLNTGQFGPPPGLHLNVEPVWIQGITGCDSVVAIVDDGKFSSTLGIDENIYYFILSLTYRC